MNEFIVVGMANVLLCSFVVSRNSAQSCKHCPLLVSYCQPWVAHIFMGLQWILVKLRIFTKFVIIGRPLRIIFFV